MAQRSIRESGVGRGRAYRKAPELSEGNGCRSWPDACVHGLGWRADGLHRDRVYQGVCTRSKDSVSNAEMGVPRKTTSRSMYPEARGIMTEVGTFSWGSLNSVKMVAVCYLIRHVRGYAEQRVLL